MKIAYRAELDGLRAISVFAVIIFHCNFVLFGHTLFQGGFIGVDIFFVISGYLITTLILKEIYESNQFSLKYFYERRIRRILPVLLFVVVVTSIISFFILTPLSLRDFGRSVLSIIFLISNIYFWATGQKYGDESELIRPLLHTWSLSVEEQFYIFFPIFLIIIIKYLRQHLVTILFIIFSFSLIFAQWSSETDIKINYNFFKFDINFFEKFNFYFIQSRIFEFLIGSLLSYFKLNSGLKGRKSYSILNQIYPSLGILLILYSFLFFNFRKIFHPSVITLIPLVGVSLIIWFSKKGELITEILSSKIFVFFGLISYSLYLWHYPIFAFLRYSYVFNGSILIKLLSILLTIILSILSYYLIERPFRNKNIISIKALTAYILIITIILLSYSFYILKTKGIKSRVPNILAEEFSTNLDNNLLNRTGGNLKNVLLIGDSHSDTLKYHFNKELTKQSYNFYKKNSVLYLKNFNLFNKKTNLQDRNYIEDTKEIDKFLQEHKDLIVVWHQRWSLLLTEKLFDNNEGYTEYQNEEDKYLEIYLQPIDFRTETLEQRQKYIIEGIKSSAKNILEKGHSLILVYPVPEIGFDVQKLIIRQYVFSKMLDKKYELPIKTISYDVYKNRNKMIFETLDDIQGPNVYKVYPHKSFCNTIIVNRCVVNNNKNIFYYDNNHLSLKGSEYVVNNIMKIIKKIEINKRN
jgi:peptidoglycan/LPS O-acetylase OafA/YrhL